MNIAIVVGVSNYVNPKNNLPGCAHDAELIQGVLLKTQKFIDVLYINKTETSAKTKELISEFISANKGNVIDELFFYYTGHGKFTDSEFYYVLSDYDEKKRNQTSLQNSEIDDLFRTLSPKLVVKVIDACQSGTNYIKEGNVLDKYFNETKKGFDKCYFLNSSLNNQSSFQTESISHFTNSFIKALRDHQTSEIRYKDIIDVIADDFLGNVEQTPFFVIQADYTEKFCTISHELKAYLNGSNETIDTSNDGSDTTLSLIDVIKSDAKDYVDQQGAISAIKSIEDQVRSLTFSKEVTELYTSEINVHQDYKSIPKTRAIAKWMEENKNDFFAKVLYEDRWDEETGQEYEVTTGFDLIFETPFKGITIDFNSRYPNVTSYQCGIVFLLSKRNLRFFHFITNYTEANWEKRHLNAKELKWITNEVRIGNKDAIKVAINSIRQNIESQIHRDLEAKFAPSSTESASNPTDDLPF